MSWLPLAALVPPARVLGSAITPGGEVTGNVVSYIVGYGPLGIVALALAYVLYKGLLVPSKAAAKALAESVALARADLVRENERLIAEKTKAEEQRDEALKIAQTQLVPLLASFTATVSALLPLLQDLVREREARKP